MSGQRRQSLAEQVWDEPLFAKISYSLSFREFQIVVLQKLLSVFVVLEVQS